MPAELDSCVEHMMAQGHSESEAYAMCNASLYGSSNNLKSKEYSSMSQEVAAFPPGNGGQDKPKEDKPAEVSFNETELGVVTQFLTDAQDYLAADPNAPPELKDEAGKAFEIVYGKVNVDSGEGEQKPPQ